MTPYPSPTKTWHDKAYPAIDPTRPELSCQGKVVAVTGAGGAIGSAIVRQFIRAGASKIALLGHREQTLHETKTKLNREFPKAQLGTIRADISDADSMRGALGNVKQDLGLIDIFVANAGYLPDFTSIVDADEEEWLRGFEVNAMGAFNTIRALVPVASPGCVLVEISTGLVGMPPLAKSSGYSASKTAGTKTYEVFGDEQGDVRVMHVHPGVVESVMNLKTGMKAVDHVDLPASFVVWAASDEAKFLSNRFLWSNWDVDELMAMKDDISSNSDKLGIRLNGWRMTF